MKKMRTLIVTLGLIFTCTGLVAVHGQVAAPKSDECQLPDVRDELALRLKRDQDARHAMMSAAGETTTLEQRKALFARVHEIDSHNTKWLKAQVKSHGWLGKSLVGTDGAHNAWFLIQHAKDSLDFQKECLKMMSALDKGEVSTADIAYLTDITRWASGQKQVYGTRIDYVDGKPVIRNVEDEAQLPQRRAAMGLPTVEEYLDQVRGAYAQ